VYQSYMEVLLGGGIFNADGELWRKQRKTASFEFASKNLRDFSTVVFREYSLKLSAILSEASVQNQEVDMQVNSKAPYFLYTEHNHTNAKSKYKKFNFSF
jgi:hypothetical protein